MVGPFRRDGVPGFQVSIADAAALLQYIGNPDKYALTEQGKKNAENVRLHRKFIFRIMMVAVAAVTVMVMMRHEKLHLF